MVKRKLLAIASLLVVLVLLVSGCSVEPTGGSADLSGQASQGDTQQVQTTEETTIKKPTKPADLSKVISFTFDDGPRNSTTGRILDVLEANGCTATFFVVGTGIAGSEDMLKRAVSLGCEIGNHSWSHSNLSKLEAGARNAEINKVNNEIERITGVRPKLLRAPYGSYGSLEGDVDMPIIQWSIDTNDWRKKKSAGDPAAARELADYILENVDTGSIVLMHDIYEFTAEVCELVIPELTQRGYTIVSVSTMYDFFGKPLNAGTVYSHPSPDTETTT